MNLSGLQLNGDGDFAAVGEFGAVEAITPYLVGKL